MPFPLLAAAGIAIGSAVAGAVTDQAVDWAVDEMSGDDEEQQQEEQQAAESSEGNSILGALGNFGPLGAIAGLLVAAIQALADANDRGQGDVQYAGRVPDQSDRELRAKEGNEIPGAQFVSRTAMIPDGFSPVTAAYSGDDKGLALQAVQLQTL
ncbi:hypothetical protein [Streptomonospora arabica]|uniref:Uncharacterized protein n=1 Tax=Streptomonospora arabica TaxID=412417 RepID=A0ABV9SMC7_9ACTN